MAGMYVFVLVRGAGNMHCVVEFRIRVLPQEELANALARKDIIPRYKRNCIRYFMPYIRNFSTRIP